MLGLFPEVDPSSLEEDADFSTAVPVWEDDRESELVRYYISPLAYIPREVIDFVEEYKYYKSNPQANTVAFWEQNSRYTEAVKELEYQLKELPKNRGGAS